MSKFQDYRLKRHESVPRRHQDSESNTLILSHSDVQLHPAENCIYIQMMPQAISLYHRILLNPRLAAVKRKSSTFMSKCYRKLKINAFPNPIEVYITQDSDFDSLMSTVTVSYLAQPTRTGAASRTAIYSDFCAPCVDLTISCQHCHMIISTGNLFHRITEKKIDLPGLQDLRPKSLVNANAAIVSYGILLQITIQILQCFLEDVGGGERENLLIFGSQLI
ncbi:hypothetical protein E2320_021462, partial [Naja naja]